MSTKHGISIISSVHKWNDTRIFSKEALSLSKKYKVLLSAKANFKKKKIKKIEVYGLYDYNKRFLRPLNWIKILFRIMKSKSKVIHFHDPELIILGVFLKLFTNKKVVYDIHEDYTKTIIKKNWLGPLWVRKIISRIFGFLETNISNIFDLNIIVIDNWMNKYKNSVVVKNYPVIEKIDFDDITKKNRVVYIGNLGKERGIEEMIESFDKLSNEDIVLDLIGKWSNEKLKEKIMPKINLNKNINFLGYLPISEAKKYLKEAKLGFCLYTDKKFEENIPVKMYEYLSYGTPVLFSNFESWKNKISKEGWGIPVNPSNIEEIIKEIDCYFENDNFPNYFKKCIEYRKKYDWKNEEEKLLDAYNNLLGDDDK